MSTSSTKGVYDKHFSAISQFSNRLNHIYKISLLEFLYFISFVVNFGLGKIVHLLSPEEEVYNYYNDKKNILNQLFVKKGWGWTTLVITLFYACILQSKNITNKSIKVRNAIIRFVLVTIWWIFFTQWCFGLPIMDKIFILTGGKCVIEHKDVVHKHSHLIQFFQEIENGFESSIISSYSCRKLRGNWEGGHDPSGHVFLMIHSSLYLFLETLPYWKSWTHLINEVKNVINKLKTSNKSVPEKVVDILYFIIDNPHVVIIQLISLWWFMLFMTNIYFHSLGEKFVGLLFGYAGVTVVYYVPRLLVSNKNKDQ
ncbi:inositol phospholipid synthesis and fat-storage-inducing TM-domain-containing protein [Scheffersomyces amazonensis]|uniref:inositol phospholipid synthesis and fat-storage-inducing TM-domain-containing protein n=1 Tax=Scheffersomyces amazonensis TaxID=1078765 RepID=UPI00315D8090